MGKKTNRYISKCKGEVVKGDAKTIIKRYVELSISAHDDAQRHLYLNYREHYTKVLKGG